jgi:hypothetical protein
MTALNMTDEEREEYNRLYSILMTDEMIERIKKVWETGNLIPLREWSYVDLIPMVTHQKPEVGIQMIYELRERGYELIKKLEEYKKFDESEPKRKFGKPYRTQ